MVIAFEIQNKEKEYILNIKKDWKQLEVNREEVRDNSGTYFDKYFVSIDDMEGVKKALQNKSKFFYERIMIK